MCQQTCLNHPPCQSHLFSPYYIHIFSRVAIFCVCQHTCLITHHSNHIFSPHITHTYCHLRTVWLCYIYPDCFMKGTISGNTLCNIKCTCVLVFSVILYETFLILRRSRQVIISIVHRSSCKVPIILVEF